MNSEEKQSPEKVSATTKLNLKSKFKQESEFRSAGVDKHGFTRNHRIITKPSGLVCMNTDVLCRLSKWGIYVCTNFTDNILCCITDGSLTFTVFTNLNWDLWDTFSCCLWAQTQVRSVFRAETTAGLQGFAGPAIDRDDSTVARPVVEILAFKNFPSCKKNFLPSGNRWTQKIQIVAPKFLQQSDFLFSCRNLFKWNM